MTVNDKSMTAVLYHGLIVNCSQIMIWLRRGCVFSVVHQIPKTDVHTRCTITRRFICVFAKEIYAMMHTTYDLVVR